jgi:hypothetical protein
VLTPAALNFFVSYADGAVESLWSIDQYFEFVLVLMLSTGLSFQARLAPCCAATARSCNAGCLVACVCLQAVQVMMHKTVRAVVRRHSYYLQGLPGFACLLTVLVDGEFAALSARGGGRRSRSGPRAAQVPVIQVLLGQTGIVTSRAMFRQWRWVVVGATVAAAVLTPSTDPFTQTLLAIPLIGLYMGGAAFVRLIEQRKLASAT